MKKILAIILTVILTIMALVGCKSPSEYSTEEHIQNISQKIQSKYMTDEFNHKSFKVYPLYNQNDEVILYMVEFQPKGFIFVEVNESKTFWHEISLGKTYYHANADYSRCLYFNLTTKERYQHIDSCKLIEKDMCGVSPYVLGGYESEKRYLFFASDYAHFPSGDCVLAIKRGSDYVNVVTNNKFDINKLKDENNVAISIEFNKTNIL